MPFFTPATAILTTVLFLSLYLVIIHELLVYK